MQVGDLVAGRYELEELLGSGGMSNVYRAHDRVLERRVALKVLHDRYSGDPEYVERFRREAQAIASLSHPNIVTIIDRGEFEGCQFIVFEHIRGETLKDIVADEAPLPVEQALALVHQAARGLAYAHGSGIVHRDVKPQNVLIDQEGIAKVTDFGIARSADRDEMTIPGTVMGTSDYISPEQASGERVDERSDQYSLGVLLYELLTGDVPYPGDSMVTVAFRHLHDPVPSVREKRPEVSPRVDAVIRRAMAKRPEDRFPSTDALIAALEVCMSEETTAGAAGDGDTQILGPVEPARSPRRADRVRRERGARPRGGGWRLPVALVVLLLGAIAVAIVASDGLVGGDGTRSASETVRLRAVSDYDPEGGDGEHPELLRDATDGDRDTYWRTETYDDFEKSGVGIVLDAGRRVELAALTITSDTPGFDAVIQASDRRGGGFSEVSEEQAIENERTRLDLDTGGTAYRYYLIWITDLDEVVHVNEVRGR
ncbi:MAG: protein kinase [Actinomycetota bacterium]|nr:protein kinase [Actinomycetota bacterium]